jgi:phospholipase C
MSRLTRRDVLRASAAAGTLAAIGGVPVIGATAAAAGRSGRRHDRRPIRHPDSRPFPHRAVGAVNEQMPFDHIVIVMMENHSFDNYLGMLPKRGQPLADGFRFHNGKPVNANRLHGKPVPVYKMTDPCQTSDSGSQSWNDTHEQIAGGTMGGFARTGVGSMGYFDEDTLPFYYGLARTFTLANRWFCSAPCQTFPNRRFLMAGTAYGLIATENSSFLDPPPPNGTIFDRLSAQGISWANYFTDLPSSGIIPSTIEKHPLNIRPVAEFYLDAKLGLLPAVSLIDPGIGALDDVGGAFLKSTNPVLDRFKRFVRSQGGDDENPQDVQIGEAFVARIVRAVMGSPQWRRTLLLWTYDEHGGYYDHVPPPRVLAPDHIKPKLSADNVPGSYQLLGPRVPAVVVSAHSKPNAVTNVVHDHTSVLATIEHKWNLPALTYRDANAHTMMDFLDPHKAHFAEPPKLPAAARPLAGEAACLANDPSGA